MIWIPILSIPLALSLVKLGAAITLAKVLAVALQVALALLVIAVGALAWIHLGRTPKTR
ncbi:MAG: hypothetical protein ACT6SF_13255 [Hydrogenophaga sp.]|uniref:hypothetical protein n=1 Tax=Hydrogenophaga sp. TaxID=1904254 RepID=UPI004034F720